MLVSTFARAREVSTQHEGNTGAVILLKDVQNLGNGLENNFNNQCTADLEGEGYYYFSAIL